MANRNTVVPKGSIAGKATIAIAKMPVATPTIITRSLLSNLLLAAKTAGHKYTIPVRQLSMAPANTLPASPPPIVDYPLSAVMSIPNKGMTTACASSSLPFSIPR
jgi:hypothetical protein